MRALLALALVCALTLPALASDDDEDDQDNPYNEPETYTTVPLGPRYGQGSGWTTYDGAYTHACVTTRLGMGYVTSCR